MDVVIALLGTSGLVLALRKLVYGTPPILPQVWAGWKVLNARVQGYYGGEDGIEVPVPVWLESPVEASAAPGVTTAPASPGGDWDWPTPERGGKT